MVNIVGVGLVILTVVIAGKYGAGKGEQSVMEVEPWLHSLRLTPVEHESQALGKSCDSSTGNLPDPPRVFRSLSVWAT
jgi:hypothetical protein